MLALFCGTASLPHIRYRYYTVKDEAAGAQEHGGGYREHRNLLRAHAVPGPRGDDERRAGCDGQQHGGAAASSAARSFNHWLFAIISAVAFTTVLGTVSGLIMASSGAVAHDLMSNLLRLRLDDAGQVRAGKAAAVVVGIIAMVLGMLFQHMNVSFLVGWAFNIAASANLPALVMLLFCAARPSRASPRRSRSAWFRRWRGSC